MKNDERTGLAAVPRDHRGHPRRNRLAAGAVAAMTIVVLGGCSASITTTKQLDTDKAEELIKAHLQEKVEGLVVGEVSCPEREVKQGDVSECTAQVDGQPFRVRMTQDDDEGNISIEPVQAILDMKQAVTLIEQQVSKAKGTPVKADCGTQAFLVKDPGATFDCRATPRSGRPVNRVVVTVKDVEGNVDLTLA